MMFNSFLTLTSGWLNYLSSILGIVGFVVGVYNWNSKRQIIRKRNQTLYRTLKSMKEYKKFVNDVKNSERCAGCKRSFKTLYEDFLGSLLSVLEFDRYTIDRLVRDEVLDTEDAEYMHKINP